MGPGGPDSLSVNAGKVVLGSDIRSCVALKNVVLSECKLFHHVDFDWLYMYTYSSLSSSLGTGYI